MLLSFRYLIREKYIVRFHEKHHSAFLGITVETPRGCYYHECKRKMRWSFTEDSYLKMWNFSIIIGT